MVPRLSPPPTFPLMACITALLPDIYLLLASYPPRRRFFGMYSRCQFVVAQHGATRQSAIILMAYVSFLTSGHHAQGTHASMFSNVRGLNMYSANMRPVRVQGTHGVGQLLLNGPRTVPSVRLPTYWHRDSRASAPSPDPNTTIPMPRAKRSDAVALSTSSPPKHTYPEPPKPTR